MTHHTQIPPFKASGFTFSLDQLKQIVANYYDDGEEVQEVTASTTLASLCQKNDIGTLRCVVIPKGVDIPGSYYRHGVRKCYFLAVRFEPLSSQETYKEYEILPLDANDEEMRRKFAWLGKYGCTQENLTSRWMTFSEWSFFDHQSENDAEVEGEGKGWERPVFVEWLYNGGI